MDAKNRILYIMSSFEVFVKKNLRYVVGATLVVASALKDLGAGDHKGLGAGDHKGRPYNIIRKGRPYNIIRKGRSYNIIRQINNQKFSC